MVRRVQQYVDIIARCNNLRRCLIKYTNSTVNKSTSIIAYIDVTALHAYILQVALIACI